MIFPHSFYEDEIRCDFVVPSMVKRTWAAQLEILSDVEKACEENGLEYFADWGTLLGAVRHGGFIPWDDDMDICMRRTDYDRFIKNASTILPDNYSIVSYRSSRDFKQMMSRVVSSDHYRFDPGYMHKYSGLPIALGIDVFPLDNLTDDEEYEKEREKRINLVYEAVNEIGYYKTDPSAIAERLKTIEMVCHVRLDRKGDILTQLRELLEKLFSEVADKDAKYVTIFQLWIERHTYRLPAGYFTRSIRLPFECGSIRASAHYDRILKKMYGINYLNPVRSGGAHEYPYYEEHMNVLREHFGYELPAYRFSGSDLSVPDEDEDPAGKQTVVFVTYSPKAFENMRSLVTEYAGKGYDVTILPAERFDIAPDMSDITPADDEVSDDHYMCGGAKVRVTHDPHVLDTNPDVIVSNYPYDEFNLITTVDKAFYSRALRSRTKKLVYVPPFEAKSFKEDDERAKKLMPEYVCTPMPVICDEIVLHSDEMKQGYVECLTAFSLGRYRDVWERKIRVLKDENKDPQTNSKDGKRRILLYVGIGSFAQYGEKVIKKLADALEIFAKTKDKADVIIGLQEGLCDTLERLYPELYAGFLELDGEATEAGISTQDIDAYYGEPSRYVPEFINAGKPVLIMNCDV